MAQAYGFMGNQPKVKPLPSLVPAGADRQQVVQNQTNQANQANQQRRGLGMASVASVPGGGGSVQSATLPGGQAGDPTLPQLQGWSLPPWNPTTPQPGLGNQGTPREGGGEYWAGQFGGTGRLFNPGTFGTPNTPYSRMLEETLPAAQFMQNASQYRDDFNEAQRRWNLEQGWGQTADQFNMGLAGRQQMSAEEQARVAAQQWGNQFDWTKTTDQWGRELSQGQLANALQETANTGAYQRGIVGNQAAENLNTGLYQRGLVGIGQQENINQARQDVNTAAYQRGLVANQARENINTGAYQRGLVGIGQQENINTGVYQRGLVSNQARENINTAAYQTGLINVQRQANFIDQAFKTGQISNEQRNLALQELTQRNQNLLGVGTLAESQRSARAAEALRQQEINQQIQIAAMQAYGRSQAPSVRWQGAW